jgi:hypothetical protein
MPRDWRRRLGAWEDEKARLAGRKRRAADLVVLREYARPVAAYVAQGLSCTRIARIYRVPNATLRGFVAEELGLTFARRSAPGT